MTSPLPKGRPGERMVAIAGDLTRRFRLTALQERHGSVTVVGAFAFVNGCLAIGVISLGALATGSPLVFPSLGPTAFLHFSTPMAPAACPRNTMCGHAVGVVAGVASLHLFGLAHTGPAFAAGVDGARVAATALSLGFTSGAMVWLRVPHPPAGATTMIISLGILTQPRHLGVLMLGVGLHSGDIRHQPTGGCGLSPVGAADCVATISSTTGPTAS